MYICYFSVLTEILQKCTDNVMFPPSRAKRHLKICRFPECTHITQCRRIYTHVEAYSKSEKSGQEREKKTNTYLTSEWTTHTDTVIYTMFWFWKKLSWRFRPGQIKAQNCWDEPKSTFCTLSTAPYLLVLAPVSMLLWHPSENTCS